MFPCFSFRVGSTLKWGVYIKLKVSWLHAFLWCMNQTSRDRVNSCRVRTHENNSGDATCRLGTIIQSIFVPNQEPAFAWPFGNGLVRVSTQGLFHPRLKTFVAPFLPAPLTALGSPRMHLTWLCSGLYKKIYYKEVWQKIFSNIITVMLVTQGFDVSCPSPS